MTRLRTRRRNGSRWGRGLVALTIALTIVSAAGGPGRGAAVAAADDGSEPAGAEDAALADHARVREALDLLALWVDAERAYEQIPGVSMAVVHDQELLWSRGFGHADREAERPATPRTLYSICSISKLFTSIGVMQQRDRGRLRLADPVERHLPWFEIQRTDPEAPPITVEGLLTHSAGLPRESGHPYWTAPEFDFPSREQVIERLPERQTLYPASRYFQYSNLGLTLAGRLVEELSGRPYAEYVRAEILDPLALEDTYPEIPEQHRDGRLATGYGAITREGVRERMPFFQAEGIAPAAGYASTVEDLARFASWQFRLLENGGEEVVHANTLREMHRVHWVDPDWDVHWGLGFSVWRSDDTTFVGHGGSCPGYRSHLALQPRDRIAAVVMINSLGVSPREYTDTAHRILGPAIAAAEAEREQEEGTESEAADEAPERETSPSDPDETEIEELPPDQPAQQQRDTDGPGPDLEAYTGTYEASFGGELTVLVWKDGLAAVYLPTDDPLDGLMELEHVEDDTFRRVRENGELGEEIVFERDDDGDVIRLVRHSNRYPKVR